MLRILMADDHALLREGLKKVLVDGLGKFDVGEAENGAEVLTLVQKKNWDIVVMDKIGRAHV